MRWVYAHSRAPRRPELRGLRAHPLEAAAFGTSEPALRAGGYLDTVREGVTGSRRPPRRRALPRRRLDAAAPPLVAGDPPRARAGFSRRPFAARLRAEVDDLLARR